MSELESAACEIAQILDVLEIPHMLVGGMALAAWGEPRATLDVDITIWAPGESTPIISAISAKIAPAVSDPSLFVAKTRVLPVRTVSGVRIDLLFAAFPFESR